MGEYHYRGIFTPLAHLLCDLISPLWSYSNRVPTPESSSVQVNIARLLKAHNELSASPRKPKVLTLVMSEKVEILEVKCFKVKF
jgi:hypothetical protein